MIDRLGIVPNPDFISKWVKYSIFNFLIATVYGAVLRLAYVFEIPWLDFKNLLHGHSHVAMMGWLYLALFTLLYDKFVLVRKKAKKLPHLIYGNTNHRHWDGHFISNSRLWILVNFSFLFLT